MAVILETSLGDITLDLLTDDRPRACLNFLKLCKVKYFNMCLFHSVQRNLVAQSGDPEGTGRGGASIFKSLYGEQAAYFEAETKPRIKHTVRGLVSMVNDGNGMHGSQFFITLADDLDYLDQQGHTVFGEVSEGEEVLDKINEIYCDKESKPYQNIRILHAVVLEDPYDDPSGLQVPGQSPIPGIKDYENGRLEYDEDIEPFKGKTEAEIQAIQTEKAAKANAQILEMIGDLPDQDVAPEDNVLFVCKLNPVTTDDDLEIIFSQFGAIKSCEVIKDSKSGESLQYAFIEFKKKAYCENAYFKMDNVLIDDRRIHVDFSQSVAKVKWRGKGKGVDTFDDKKEKSSSNSKPQSIYGLNFDSMPKKAGNGKSGGTGKKGDNSHRKRSESRSISRERKRKSKSLERKPKRSVSREKDVKLLKSKHRRQSRDRSTDRRRSRSNNRKRSRSRSNNRRRSRSDSRRRSKSKGRRSRSRDRVRRSRDKDRKYHEQRRRSRSRSRDRNSDTRRSRYH